MMIANTRRLGFFAALFLATIQLGQAQDLSAPVNFFFTRTNLPLWHLSGDYQIVQQIKGAGGEPVNLSFFVTLGHDPRGRIQGQGTTIVDVGGSFLAGNYVAQGRVSGGSTHPVKMTFSIHIKGQDVLSGQLTSFNISLNYKLQVDGDVLALVGTAKGNANFKNVGAGGPVNSQIVVPLPGNETGAWEVTMDIAPLSKLTGTATMTTSDGFVLNDTLTGSFSGKRTLAKVHLKGIDQSSGTSANIQFAPTELGNVLQSLKGHVLGQTLKY